MIYYNKNKVQKFQKGSNGERRMSPEAAAKWADIQNKQTYKNSSEAARLETIRDNHQTAFNKMSTVFGAMTPFGIEELLVSRAAPYIGKGANYLYRVQPKNFDINTPTLKSLQSKVDAGTAKWFQKNTLNNPEKVTEMASRDAHYGQWFAREPKDLQYYLDDKVFESPEILRVSVKKALADKIKVQNLGSPDASRWSLLPDREFIVPRDIIDKAEKFSIDQIDYLTKTHK